MMHLRHYKISPYIGMTLTTAAVAALVVWPALPLAWAIVAVGVIGFGVGTVFPVATVSIQNAVARHQVGKPVLLELAHERAANEAPMARDEDFVRFLQGHRCSRDR